LKPEDISQMVVNFLYKAFPVLGFIIALFVLSEWLKSQYEKLLEAERKKIASNHSIEMKKLEAECEAEMKKLSDKHVKQKRKLQDEHAMEQDKLTAEKKEQATKFALLLKEKNQKIQEKDEALKSQETELSQLYSMDLGWQEDKMTFIHKENLCEVKSVNNLLRQKNEILHKRLKTMEKSHSRDQEVQVLYDNEIKKAKTKIQQLSVEIQEYESNFSHSASLYRISFCLT